jgi:FMN phosphatase YigB (HAD superfamily)
MTKPEVELLITDLDNTLYDWVSFFAPALRAMTIEAARILGVSEERVIDDLRVVHQYYGTSERPFALLDALIVAERLPTRTRQERAAFLDQAFHAFNRERKQALQLYPGVRETLARLNERCTVVAHTESSAVNAMFRLTKLELTASFQRVYVSADRDLAHPYPERVPDVSGISEKLRILRPTERKPDPQIVRDICCDMGVETNRCVYVGDSLSRDVLMAKHAGASAVWARYGTSFAAEHWAQLVRVTHWTAEDVQRDEEARRELGTVAPDIVIDRFEALLDALSFGPSQRSDIHRLAPSSVL